MRCVLLLNRRFLGHILLSYWPCDRDDSTLSTNQPDILDNHLKETVDDIEKTNSIKLMAIGIGHDVSKYYKNAFVIEDAENLGDVIISNLTNLLGNSQS